MKQQRHPIAMLTAYDHPSAVMAQAAGVHALLVGDSLGCVLLGWDNTRSVTLALMIPLAEAVRRGAPSVYLVGDLPFESVIGGPAGVAEAANRFVQESGCDAVKVEVGGGEAALIESVVAQKIACIAHLGLRPQTVVSPDGYRAQARDTAGVDELVRDAKRMVEAGAAMLLLEAVPNEASLAVMGEVGVPVIGCGAGPACDGHVIVTHDMLGLGAARLPRFVPKLADARGLIESAMRQYVAQVESREYPAAEHTYSMRGPAAPPPSDPAGDP